MEAQDRINQNAKLMVVLNEKSSKVLEFTLRGPRVSAQRLMPISDDIILRIKVDLTK